MEPASTGEPPTNRAGELFARQELNGYSIADRDATRPHQADSGVGIVPNDGRLK